MDNIYNFFTLILTVLGVYIAVWTKRSDRKAKEADEKYQEVVEKLASLELIVRTQAEITIFFEVTRYLIHDSNGNNLPQVAHSLIVKNIGNVEARNINIDIKPVMNPIDGKGKIEFYEFVRKTISPISILASGSDVSYRFAEHPRIAHEHIGVWHWENPDGSQSRRESHLRISL